MTAGEKHHHRQTLNTSNPFSHFCPHPSLALLEHIVHWADRCTAPGELTLGNRAQLLEDARQVHAQGTLRVLTVPCLCSGGKQGSSPAASAFCCCTGQQCSPLKHVINP